MKVKIFSFVDDPTEDSYAERMQGVQNDIDAFLQSATVRFVCQSSARNSDSRSSRVTTITIFHIPKQDRKDPILPPPFGSI